MRDRSALTARIPFAHVFFHFPKKTKKLAKNYCLKKGEGKKKIIRIVSPNYIFHQAYECAKYGITNCAYSSTFEDSLQTGGTVLNK